MSKRAQAQVAGTPATMATLVVGQHLWYVAGPTTRPCTLVQKLDGRQHQGTRVRVRFAGQPEGRPETVMVASLVIPAAAK